MCTRSSWFSRCSPQQLAQERDTKDPDVRDIGALRELFVDRFHIERLDNAAFKLHEPAKMPRPQSPLIGTYVNVIKGGDFFRAVYRSYDPSYKGE
jgi:hypothetical protein